MKTIKTNLYEKAQVLPWLVIGFIAIIAMAALILDGSGLLLNRREAQAAADAGALAGAKQICLGESATTIESTAENYALQYGIAPGAISASYNDATKRVTVNVVHGHEKWFAGVITSDPLTTGATATAACLGPRGRAVLPLAWNCRAPTVGGPFDPNSDCKITTLDWNDELRPLVEGEDSDITIDGYTYTLDGNSVVRPYVSGVDNPLFAGMKIAPSQIYIVMDSDKECHELNPLNPVICDLDGDGKLDIQLGGDRGWLYLTADTSSINKWIKDPLPISLKPHQWLSGKGGADISIYKDMNNLHEGEVVLVPVYNTFCGGVTDPTTNATCMNDAHDPLYWPPIPPGGDITDQIKNKDNYHIITFAPFYVSCVDTKDNCPGAKMAVKLNKVEDKTFKINGVVEGFFLSNADVPVDPSSNCDVNIGDCQVSLTD